MIIEINKFIILTTTNQDSVGTYHTIFLIILVKNTFEIYLKQTIGIGMFKYLSKTLFIKTNLKYII